MTKPTIRIHDLELNEIIDREMTDAEFAEHEEQIAKNATIQAKAESKGIAKAALLKKLGISEAEAELLLA